MEEAGIFRAYFGLWKRKHQRLLDHRTAIRHGGQEKRLGAQRGRKCATDAVHCGEAEGPWQALINSANLCAECARSVPRKRTHKACLECVPEVRATPDAHA